MNFVDEVEILVRAGHGGRGNSSFRREKYVPLGGPDGGDGGRGGHVILRATAALTTLFELRHQRLWAAENGTPGGTRYKTGASGDDLVIAVPVGTIVRRVGPDGAVEDAPLLELLTDGEERVLAEGGSGGLGNVHFKTSTNRAPRKTTPGYPGQELRVRLELKLMADVGLLGFPNAGKSTLISRISHARPRIADYPFTTLVPQLGVVSMGTAGAFVVADIPGLIEGAAEGRGLGHRFLRHVERTRLFVHLLSLAEPGEPVDRWRVLRDELGRYDPALLDRPEVVVLSQADTVSAARVDEASRALVAAGAPAPMVISAVTGQGVDALVSALWSRIGDVAPDRDRL